MIANKSKPQSSKKYKQRQLKEWGQLDKLYHKCTAFDAFLRPSSEDVQVELNGKVEKVPSVLSEGTSLEEKANQIVDRNGGGDTGICSSSTQGRSAICIRRFLCFRYLILILSRVTPGGGGLPYKNEGSPRRTF